MPTRARRPCSEPGCTNLVERGRYCEQHKRRTHVSNRPSAAMQGYGAQWRKLRLTILRRDPVCRDPFGVHVKQNEVVLSTDVDHIFPKKQGGRDDPDNLQGLCHACHARKGLDERKGGRLET